MPTPCECLECVRHLWGPDKAGKKTLPKIVFNRSFSDMFLTLLQYSRNTVKKPLDTPSWQSLSLANILLLAIWPFFFGRSGLQKQIRGIKFAAWLTAKQLTEVQWVASTIGRTHCIGAPCKEGWTFLTCQVTSHWKNPRSLYLSSAGFGLRVYCILYFLNII